MPFKHFKYENIYKCVVWRTRLNSFLISFLFRVGSFNKYFVVATVLTSILEWSSMLKVNYLVSLKPTQNLLLWFFFNDKK